MKEDIKNLIEEKEINLEEMMDAHDLYETIDYDGSLHQLIDGMIDIYYYDLRKWRVENYNYIDEAINEGLCDPKKCDFHGLITWGQYVYYSAYCRDEVEEIFNEYEEATA